MNTETLEKTAEIIEETLTEDQVAEKAQAPEEEDSIFAGKKHFPIFPTNLFEFVFKEEESKKINDCLPHIQNLGDADKANWVTQPNLNTLDEFKEVLSLLTEGMKEVLGFSGVRFDEMLITSLRAYRHTTPNLGPQEVRPNNLLSGVLFLKTDKKGVVTFFDPRPQAWIIKPPVSEANIFNSDAFSIESQENKMLVFPAWLQYQVAFKEGMEENIYLSWTAMVRGGAKSN